MSWQVWVVLAAVALAALYLAASLWRAAKGQKTGCGGGCRCSGESATKDEQAGAVIPVEQVTLRRREPDGT